MAEHTPTPWRVFKNKDGTRLVGIGGQDGQGTLDAGFGVWSWDSPEGIANAEMVVKAVNNHEALVNALAACRDALAGCYNVADWPADGSTSQDRALAMATDLLNAVVGGAQGNG